MTKENNQAKQLGPPHLQDMVDGLGRSKSLPQLGMPRAIQKKSTTVASSDEALSLHPSGKGKGTTTAKHSLFPPGPDTRAATALSLCTGSRSSGHKIDFGHSEQKGD
jgi:hypothetical protein